MLTINDYYKENSGTIYTNIRDIHYEQKEDILGNLGKFITETKHEATDFFKSSDNISIGVYVYLTYYDKNKALRIYKDWADYKYNYHNDVKLVSELQKRQKKIKLTEFPTGIVTIENNVIGQEIPFYANYNNIYEQIKLLKNKKEALIYYKQILIILKELYDNEIIYEDIHAKNFLIKKDIKLIDFEKERMSFDINSCKKQNMLDNLIIMINKLNQHFSINFQLEKVTSLEEIERQLKLVK